MKFHWGRSPSLQTSESYDYASKTQSELLECFQTEQWSLLVDERKIAVLQEVENRIASEQHRPPAQIVSSTRLGEYGSYYSLNNRIDINMKDYSSYHTLDTLLHESNHAYQQHCIETGAGYDEYARGMMQAEFARDSDGLLYNYSRDAISYDMQCSEIDSNNVAAGFLLSQQDRYGDDPSYREYVAERQEHFSEVNQLLHEKPEVRYAMQTNQLQRAYLQGDLSQEQFSKLESEVNNPEFSDPMVQSSQEIGAKFSELHGELTRDGEYSQVEDEYLGSLDDTVTPPEIPELNSEDYVGTLDNTETPSNPAFSAETYLGSTATEAENIHPSIESSYDKSNLHDSSYSDG